MANTRNQAQKRVLARLHVILVVSCCSYVFCHNKVSQNLQTWYNRRNNTVLLCNQLRWRRLVLICDVKILNLKLNETVTFRYTAQVSTHQSNVMRSSNSWGGGRGYSRSAWIWSSQTIHYYINTMDYSRWTRVLGHQTILDYHRPVPITDPG